MIKSYDYGILNSANVPSEVNFNKRSLGQNASQSMCLFRHLPFILNEYRSHPILKKAWKCVETLEKICEIVSSYEISENNRQRLINVTEMHLKYFYETFKEDFKPKQHNLLHYANIISEVGPLRHFSMMKYDAKHRVFKIFRNATNNFKDINKSMAYKHQKLMCANGFGYKDNIVHGVLKPYNDLNRLNLMCNFATCNETIFRTKYVKLNNYRYSAGLLIVYKGSFFEISQILCAQEKFYFLCLRYIIDEFDHFLNSYKIKTNDNSNLTVISFEDIQYKKTHEIKRISENKYVISESLDLRSHLQQ